MINQIKEKVLEYLVHCAPNFVHMEHITRRLEKYSPEDIQKAIELLLKEKKIKSTPSNVWHADEAFSLTSYENIPIRKTIKVGNTSVTRLLSSHMVQATLEDINIALEKLAEYSASLEEESHKKYEEEIKKYWGNIIIIFGIFVAIFSLINVALGRIAFPSNYDFWQILSANTAQVLPVALVLALFIFVLSKVFR
jgi:hypothetical protein